MKWLHSATKFQWPAQVPPLLVDLAQASPDFPQILDPQASHRAMCRTSMANFARPRPQQVQCSPSRPMRQPGPRRDTAEIPFQSRYRKGKGPLERVETDLPVSPSSCDLMDLDVCCIPRNFKRPVLPMPTRPLLWSSGSVARWHLVLSKRLPSVHLQL